MNANLLFSAIAALCSVALSVRLWKRGCRRYLGQTLLLTAGLIWLSAEVLLTRHVQATLTGIILIGLAMAGFTITEYTER